MSSHEILTNREQAARAMECFQYLKPWLAGGRRQMAAELAHGRKVHLPKSPEQRDPTPHSDIMYAMRATIPSPPEVDTPELQAEYRKLMNMRKALRRMLRA